MAIDWSKNEVAEYLRKAAPKVGMESLLVRTTNSLLRSGVDTMEKLCAMDEEALRSVRNMGEKSREFAILVRDKYRHEQNK